MRKLLFACLLAAFTAQAKAQNAMAVHNGTDGSKTNVALKDIDKLTFGDNKMVVDMKGGRPSQTFDLNAFNKLTFESLATAIAGTSTEREGLKFSFDGESLRVSGLKKASAAVLYNASGAAVQSLAAWDGTKFSVASLPQGVYMLTVNGVAYKFLKK